MPSVQKIEIDQCFYSMMTTHDDGTPGPAQKSTLILANSLKVADMLRKGRCPNRADRAAGRPLEHHHAQLIGGRASQAQVSPRRLCRDICIGISNQRRADELGVVALPVLSIETMREIATSARARAR